MYSYASVIMTQSIEKSIMNDTIKYKKKKKSHSKSFPTTYVGKRF